MSELTSCIPLIIDQGPELVAAAAVAAVQGVGVKAVVARVAEAPRLR